MALGYVFVVVVHALLTGAHPLRQLLLILPVLFVAFVLFELLPFVMSAKGVAAEIARLEELLASAVEASRKDLGATT